MKSILARVKVIFIQKTFQFDITETCNLLLLMFFFTFIFQLIFQSIKKALVGNVSHQSCRKVTYS